MGSSLRGRRSNTCALQCLLLFFYYIKSHFYIVGIPTTLRLFSLNFNYTFTTAMTTLSLRTKLVFRREKQKIWKNLILICFAFLCNFTAFGGISTLQSSLNYAEGLGTVSLSVLYASLILSAMFTPTLGKLMEL